MGAVSMPGAAGRGRADGGDVMHIRGANPLLFYSPADCIVTLSSECATALPPLDCSNSWLVTLLQTAKGGVVGFGQNGVGQLGGDRTDHEALVAARLPWPVEAVRCGAGFATALRRGGTAVCSWGYSDARLGRSGPGPLPAEVLGLPPGDPVTLLEVGNRFTIAVTLAGEAYGWGLSHGVLFGTAAAPARIAALSGRALRRLACSSGFVAAETRAGELLFWGRLADRMEPLPVPLLPASGRVSFPLRSLAAAGNENPNDSVVAAADASGRLWCLWGEGQLARAELPAGERVVRAVACCGAYPLEAWDTAVVALTDRGHLWDCRACGTCRSINAAHPDLPLGLLPACGANSSRRVALLRDPWDGGKALLRVFARIAVRLGVPSDPVRAVLVRFMVHWVKITGPESEPFGWPGDPPKDAGEQD